MNFAIGLVITVGCILGGYAALGGHLEVLFQRYEFVIIAGSSHRGGGSRFRRSEPAPFRSRPDLA